MSSIHASTTRVRASETTSGAFWMESMKMVLLARNHSPGDNLRRNKSKRCQFDVSLHKEFVKLGQNKLGGGRFSPPGIMASARFRGGRSTPQDFAQISSQSPYQGAER